MIKTIYISDNPQEAVKDAKDRELPPEHTFSDVSLDRIIKRDVSNLYNSDYSLVQVINLNRKEIIKFWFDNNKLKTNVTKI